ncbi:hypothetical protein N7528_005829 [Penicillium herquei]|nr:hypothetical protein N7528_005829 [Penicillium herquei]
MADTTIETTLAIRTLPSRTLPNVSVWTELKVPKDAELDEKQWKGNFTPLLSAPGHITSMWARAYERSDNKIPPTEQILRPSNTILRTDRIILATLWKSTKAYHDFLASPSAQLFAESLSARGITKEATHESTDGSPGWFSQLGELKVQLFWLSFPSTITTEDRALLGKQKGFWLAKSKIIWRGHMSQTRFAVKLWPSPAAAPQGDTDVSMIWVHFWQEWEEVDVGKGVVSFFEGHQLIDSKPVWEEAPVGGSVEATTCTVSCCSFKEL